MPAGSEFRRQFDEKMWQLFNDVSEIKVDIKELNAKFEDLKESLSNRIANCERLISEQSKFGSKIQGGIILLAFIIPILVTLLMQLITGGSK